VAEAEMEVREVVLQDIIMLKIPIEQVKELLDREIMVVIVLARGSEQVVEVPEK
jgi:hypothetical protein